jgi:hypothetical protein
VPWPEVEPYPENWIRLFLCGAAKNLLYDTFAIFSFKLRVSSHFLAALLYD